MSGYSKDELFWMLVISAGLGFLGGMVSIVTVFYAVSWLFGRALAGG